MRKDMILITGANGQIGSVLTQSLRKTYGQGQVIATDISTPAKQNGPFEHLDISKADKLNEIIKKYEVTQIYHLVAILSAKGESNPRYTWDLNMNSLLNVLDAARDFNLDKVFFPSSIAVFGNLTPTSNTPQHTVLNPSTIYGISKVAGEQWCEYYHHRYQVDVRSVRFPGIVGYQSAAGGGTTDYAVDIYHEAIKEGEYTCFLKTDTRLPMLYMDDAVRAVQELMDAPADAIKIRSSYNLSGMDFTPSEAAEAIRKHIPDFKISYKPDGRQDIADSWPDSIDDSRAREDWHWKPDYDLDSMTKDMLIHLSEKYGIAVPINS